MSIKKEFSPHGGTLDDLIIEELKRDEGFRSEYLKGLLTEQDVPFLALCLQPVVESLGGVGALSKATGLGRQSLYKALSGKRRPDMRTLLKILDFAGYELSLQKKGTLPRVLQAGKTPRAYRAGSGKATRRPLSLTRNNRVKS